MENGADNETMWRINVVQYFCYVLLPCLHIVVRTLMTSCNVHGVFLDAGCNVLHSHDLGTHDVYTRR